MKQGINFIMPVQFDVDYSTVSSIDFLFKQKNNSVNFTYPSATVSYNSFTQTFDISWTSANTSSFDTRYPIYMDTRIHCTNSVNSPETQIVEIDLAPTLFTT